VHLLRRQLSDDGGPITCIEGDVAIDDKLRKADHQLRKAPSPLAMPVAAEETSRGAVCAWCRTFHGWLEPGKERKFWSMWGPAYQERLPGSGGCWDWGGGGASRFFEDTFSGKTCDRNWLEGALGNGHDRLFESPSPALFGFDEDILSSCSAILGGGASSRGNNFDTMLADTCQRAQRNVLRLMTGQWTTCQNLEWQLCALQGKLPGQRNHKVTFASAPRDLELRWWHNPSTHPTWPCENGRCPNGGFTVGDVYFAELMVAYTICTNGAELFELAAGEYFSCELSRERYFDLAQRLRES